MKHTSLRNAWLLAGLLGTTLGTAEDAVPAARHRVLVELYTSQG